MKEHGEAHDATVQMVSTVIAQRRAVEKGRIAGGGSTLAAACAYMVASHSQ